MAKNNYLSRVFLCLIAGLCIGIGSLFVGFGDWTFGNRGNGFERVEMTEVCVVSFNQQISQLLYAPVDMTEGRNGKFDVASLNADAVRNKIKKIYTAEIGVREKTGKNDGERVEEYLAITQLGKGYAWCAAFVSWVFSEACFPEPRTPWSPALFPNKRVIWERGKAVESADNLDYRSIDLKSKLISSKADHLSYHTRSLIPKPADVFGIYFANLKRIAHVGFVDEWGDKHVITVEGNTNEAGSAEGDGVYRKRRPIASIYQVANWIDLEGEP